MRVGDRESSGYPDGWHGLRAADRTLFADSERLKDKQTTRADGKPFART